MITQEGTRSPFQYPISLDQLSEQKPAVNLEIPTFSADVVHKNSSDTSLSSRQDTTPKEKRAIRELPSIPLDPPVGRVNSDMSTASSRKPADLHSGKSEPSQTKGTSHKGVHRPELSNSMPHASDHHHSSSSRRSKHGSSRHHRLLAELLHLYPNLNPHASERTESSRSSLNGAPTDSHTHRTHPQPFRQSSTSISEILILTTEKLHMETARANAAEKQITDVMSLFKNTHDQKVKLEGDLSRIKGELGWYKVQLDVAQKEIFRAQEIVEQVDRQRVEAEEAAVRAREKSRKLSEARAVDLAMEEGRRIGFEEGLKHGRIMTQISESERSRSKSRTASAGGSGGSGARKSQPVSQSELSEASKAYKSSARPPRRSRTPGNDRKTTATQPVIVDQKRGRRLSRPEEIAIQEADAAPRSKSNYRQSPDVSRRSIVLPPDNYIPVLNPDATITLPPPHEMSLPVAAEAPSSFPPRTSGVQTPSNRPRSSSGPISVRSGEPPSYNLGDIRAPIPRRAVSPIPREGPPNSVMAAESTEPRSPSTYPNRPPRRTREIVMPVPLGNNFLPSSTNGGSAHPLPRVVANPPESSTPNDPPTPPHAVRMASNATIPDINVETPSSKSARSDRTVLDPVLLTPEYVNKPLSSHDEEQSQALGLYTEPPKVATPVQLPPGFVPLSPIPGMANLNPYPVGFNPKDQSAAKDSNYVYPSSPLVRPT